MKIILLLSTLLFLPLTPHADQPPQKPPFSSYGPEHRIYLSDVTVVIEAGEYFRGGQINKWLGVMERYAKTYSTSDFLPQQVFPVVDGVILRIITGSIYTGAQLEIWMNEAKKSYR